MHLKKFTMSARPYRFYLHKFGRKKIECFVSLYFVCLLYVSIVSTVSGEKGKVTKITVDVSGLHLELNMAFNVN